VLPSPPADPSAIPDGDSASAPNARRLTGELAVVVATRNRRAGLLDALGHLAALPEQPRLVVVDNASTDGTAAAVRAAFPAVAVVEAGTNLGGGARTLGARAVATPYVAFADDDSWWAPGALSRAVELFERHPRLALLAARVLVGPDERLDPVCRAMACSPLEALPGHPGPAVLGFVACGAVARRSAFLAVGGFDARLGVGGEEELLAIDLASRGWWLAYRDDVVAHHHPSPHRDPVARRRAQLRNALWVAWLRRPLGAALRRTWLAAAAARRDPALRPGLLDAVAALPWIVRERRVVPPAVERQILRIEAAPPP
jgi:GT2 family glycosyltransferase